MKIDKYGKNAAPHNNFRESGCRRHEAGPMGRRHKKSFAGPQQCPAKPCFRPARKTGRGVPQPRTVHGTALIFVCAIPQDFPGLLKHLPDPCPLPGKRIANSTMHNADRPFFSKSSGCVETTSNASHRKEHHPNRVRTARQPTFFGVYRRMRENCSRFVRIPSRAPCRGDGAARRHGRRILPKCGEADPAPIAGGRGGED
ncbi:hypothetical protein RHE_CH01002 [Rhizobium etli CFN 42]|uniref:Uncharacterized protein n=1 Tax=Rhizobium etli (strain ATCC 51251 / DSM 11541 / JCM 21823 / NBRC 15573 / CFN 42) TaxID=347834 RepID=Q2KBH3_RHIEC|nr:hypothetical protein RHE_CH01002 [Rhizobium etli CFN 42]